MGTGIGAHGQWVHRGNVVQGIWGTGGMGPMLPMCPIASYTPIAHVPHHSSTLLSI